MKQGFTAKMHGPGRPFSRFDPDDLAFDSVIISEYLTFVEQNRSADIHLYA